MARTSRWQIFGLWCAVALWPNLVHAQAVTPPGAQLTEGQISSVEKAFVAGPAGAVLELEPGARLTLQPGAQLRFGRTFKLQVGAGPESVVPTRVLMLDSGTMEASLPADKHFALFVEMPRKLRALLVSGELTTVASGPRSTVALAAGRAMVTLDDSWKWKALPVGQLQIVSDVRPDGYRRERLAATEAPVLSRSLLLAGGGDDASTLVAWPSLEHAVGYQVEVRGAENALVRRERTEQARLALGDLPPGQYQVSVSGVDESGIVGAPSAAVMLNVVGMDIPKTASRGPSGAVRLQANQRVTLVGADGLLVAYLGLDDFLPAPKSVGLVARRPISLLLRHPVSGETLRLDLEPLTVRAQVTFARHPESWPSEGLDVAVTLTDDHGDPVPGNFAASCRVTINVDPVAPVWEREGPVLRTRIARPPSAAPWMVRVDVVDENGASLGMDFAEVGYQTRPQRAQR
ncbi:MAG TPA: hypothetical protein VJU61_23735 [Polyangiaceae bacterium]|nr:hypothetical protein [Polyangiaceae bacterium]